MEDDILVPNPLPNLSNYIIINAAKKHELTNCTLHAHVVKFPLKREVKLKIGPIKIELL